VNESNVSTYYILDLDRTILDTIKSTEYMEGVIALHNGDLAALLTQKFEEYSLLGESFSMRDFIVENAGEEEMQKIQEKFVEIVADKDLLMPGAKELMDYIKTLPVTSFGIMTYGSELGQRMKIEAAGLGDVPSLITTETYKGALIATWRQDDELYHLPPELGSYITKEIVFVDDKPFSFKGLPIDCRGYLVKSVYDAGIEKLPSYVAQVNSLKDVLAAEKQRQS
jgi:phosphoglycolate phosphatase-like HAD superfamily hydrolase